MSDPGQNEILHQLASIRRELRFARSLLLFVSAALAILLFAPIWAADIAEWAAVMAAYVPPVVVVLATVAISRYKSSRPPVSTASTKEPAA